MSFELSQYLVWDSEFFSYRIGRVNGHHLTAAQCDTVIKWGTANAIDCLYFLADSNHSETNQVAEDNGFRFRDIRVTFDRAIGSQGKPALPESVTIRPFRLEDLSRLQEISRVAYRQTRFFNDPHFPQDRCAAMYEIWIHKSCLENYADHVIVIDLKQRPVGYVTCKLGPTKSDGSIELISVAEEERNQRLGQHLIDAALDWFEKQGIEKVSVVTQGQNIVAQRLYQKCGFGTRSVQLWYHRWAADYTHRSKKIMK